MAVVRLTMIKIDRCKKCSKITYLDGDLCLSCIDEVCDIDELNEIEPIEE